MILMPFFAHVTKIQSTLSLALAFDLTQNCQIERRRKHKFQKLLFFSIFILGSVKWKIFIRIKKRRGPRQSKAERQSASVWKIWDLN